MHQGLAPGSPGWSMAGGQGSVRRGSLAVYTSTKRASQVALVVKHPPANAGHVRDTGSIPWSGRSLGGGNGNPLRYSCLENPMGREAWQATVHGVEKS